MSSCRRLYPQRYARVTPSRSEGVALSVDSGDVHGDPAPRSGPARSRRGGARGAAGNLRLRGEHPARRGVPQGGGGARRSGRGGGAGAGAPRRRDGGRGARRGGGGERPAA
ncbi:MAG: hypothetical protein EPO40_31690 [Myxococcaceae bacterium]|nr:MAG: hypothetical protein EPO40_31690 [Myxococcaceae bacterium]